MARLSADDNEASEYLGDLPSTWKIVPAKRIARILNGATPKSGIPDYWDGDVQWITPADLSGLEVPEIRRSRRTITLAGLNSCGTSLAPSGSVVVSTRAPIGSVGIAAQPICTNQGCRTLVPTSSMDARFLFYTLSTLASVLNSLGAGSTFRELASEYLASLRLPLPPRLEQLSITRFLDHETARIDELIAKQQRLIELLKEKRQAVISHAVTKGLNPDAPTKDSGVEWLGEVPAHWSVTRLKFAAGRIVDCLHSTPAYIEDGEFPAIRTADITPGALNLDAARRVSRSDYIDRSSRMRLSGGDIIYSREGERYGMAALIPPRAEACLGQRVMAFRASEEMTPEFLMWSLNSVQVYRQAQQDVIGATSPHVNVETIKNFFMARPTIQEQQHICEALSGKLNKMTALEERARNALALLSERRTALISAAVTGKIDVRDWQPPQAGDAEAEKPQYMMAAEERAGYG